MKNVFILIAILAVLSVPGSAIGARAFRYGEQKAVLGSVERYKVKENESLYEIARTYKTGFNKIVAANPRVDPIVPGKGTSLILPTSWVLPDIVLDRGIVINISEMRLYYFSEKSGVRRVRTYPIGIGDEGAGTPVGKFKVVEKIEHPSWRVPASIRKEHPELPAVVPPGPDNPMGSHALRLSRATILIHGTDVPWGIGKRVSHGCIRLYPEDIKELFRLVPINTKVTIVRQPVKVGMSRGKVYVEVNKDPERKRYDYLGEAMNLLRKKGISDRISIEKLQKAIREKKGYPVDISLSE